MNAKTFAREEGSYMKEECVANYCQYVLKIVENVYKIQTKTS